MNEQNSPVVEAPAQTQAGSVCWGYQALWAVPMGIVGTGMMIWYVWRVTRDHDGFEKAFGAGWSDQIPPQQARHMVQKRWTWFLKMKASLEPAWERDIPFCTVPDTQRQLLCDVWRPIVFVPKWISMA